MTYNPNAVFISPSSLSDIEKCPQLYFLRNVYRSPRGLKIQLINPALALGQAMHETLDQFLALMPLERTSDELERIFLQIWSQIQGEKGGFSNPTEEEEHKTRARAMLEKFINHPHFKSAVKTKLPPFPKVELGNDLILTGKLDWLESEGSGFRIVDFKTGKNEEKDSSLQLPIYALLAREIVKSSDIRASYWYLDHDSDLVNFSLPDLDSTQKILQQKGELVKMVRQTASYSCQSGKESCWACRDILEVKNGKGKLVTLDPVNRKQEIYILQGSAEPESDIPF